ncbi:hypothetical protein Ae168Ps1_0361 [Pseudonocardia sp. Ae168_Ps1]|nr:hypothetical protein Ae150APs1_0366 [Pseudonocardia sp. Ae150A_Ps1]OLL77955.1 hypothetical protein Ae168Ps1_0361 [Pseudonocardia sp. Ae168_Ps1]
MADGAAECPGAHGDRRPRRNGDRGVPLRASRRHAGAVAAGEHPRARSRRPAGPSRHRLDGPRRRRHAARLRCPEGARPGRRRDQIDADGTGGARAGRRGRAPRPPDRRRPRARVPHAAPGDRLHGVLRPGPPALRPARVHPLPAVRGLPGRLEQRPHGAGAGPVTLGRTGVTRRSCDPALACARSVI